MHTALATVAFYMNGRVIVTLTMELANKLGRMKLIRFVSDDATARVELRQVSNGCKGQPTGRRGMYRFGSTNERIGHDHTFCTMPATVTVVGERLILEVDKTMQPLPAELVELLEAA